MAPAAEDASGAAPLIYHLTYRDAHDQVSLRVVTLRRVDPSRDLLSLICWCHTANAVRQFRTDRIEQVFCVVTGEVFEDATRYFTNHPMLTTPSDPEGYALAVCKHEVNILTIVAAADGRFDPDEQEKILIHVYDRMPDLALDEATLRRRLAKLAPDLRAYESAMIRMGQYRDGDSRALIRSMRKVIDADGQISAEEAAFVQEISARLGSTVGPS